MESTHVLLVEDEDSHAELIRRAFESRGSSIELTIAGSLDEARRIVEGAAPDLIIADWLLPDGKGTDLIPADLRGGAYPVIVMTSHGDEQVAVGAMRAGALDYVAKSGETFADMPHIAERAMREWSNIVERRRAEAALRDTEERLRTVVDLAPIVLLAVDADEVVTLCEGSGLRVLDVRPGELVGQSLSAAFEDTPDIAADCRLAFGGGTVFSTVTIGRTVFESQYSPLSDEAGEIAGVIGVLTNITESR